MEAHPAHISLPLNAKAEATDALTWSYTGMPIGLDLVFFGGFKYVQINYCRCKDQGFRRSHRKNVKNSRISFAPVMDVSANMALILLSICITDVPSNSHV
jgi:hypothetical protein